MMTTTTDQSKPRYKHDCAACTFLGAHGDVDLYHCPQHGLPTLIARRSSNPSDYTSFMADRVRNEARELVWTGLVEAYRRAFARRLPLAPAA